MKKRIRIDGMSCDNCVRHVTVALKDLDGVSEVDVRLDKKQAIIVAEEIQDQDIIDAIEEVGYEVVGIEEI
jgi:copper chaperone CopZ